MSHTHIKPQDVCRLQGAHVQMRTALNVSCHLVRIIHIRCAIVFFLQLYYSFANKYKNYWGKKWKSGKTESTYRLFDWLTILTANVFAKGVAKCLPTSPHAFNAINWPDSEGTLVLCLNSQNVPIKVKLRFPLTPPTDVFLFVLLLLVCSPSSCLLSFSLGPQSRPSPRYGAVAR